MTNAIRVLLSHVIDFAGMYPPARQPLSDAAHDYARYRAGPHAWMLGRFVVPVEKLDDCARAAAPYIAADPTNGWKLSAVAGGDLAHDLPAIAAFNRLHRDVQCDAVEVRAQTRDEIDAIAEALGRETPTVYVEIPSAGDPSPLIARIADHGLRAKIRTGGVVPAMVPPPDAVVRFIGACCEHHVSFKATAGLHHAVCGEYALTYDADSVRGPMYGFINVLLAAVWTRRTGASDATTALLKSGDPRTFAFRNDGVRWRDIERAHEALMTVHELAHARDSLVIALGSCSFEEPVNELRALGLIA
jgi:hypothetical protein